MKKFNVSSEKLAIIALTAVQVLCVFIAAAFALQEPCPNAPYYDALGCLMYVSAAVIFEVIKYKITHNDDNNEAYS